MAGKKKAGILHEGLEKIHMDEFTWYKCTICKTTFATRKQGRRHIMQDHYGYA